MKNVKAVMCDIDGTLLSSNGIVTPKTIEAIKNFVNTGFYLVSLLEEMFQVSSIY